MAYPILVTASTVNFADTVNTGTSRSISMPTVVNAGDLLVIVWHCQDSGGGTTGVLTTNLGTFIRVTNIGTSLSGTTNKYSVFYKFADGTEAGQTVTVSHANNATIGISLYNVLRITGASPTKTPQFSLVQGTTGYNTTALTAPWGADENLVINMVSTVINGANRVTTYPVGYTANGASYRVATVGQSAIATLETANVTEDPTAWVMESNFSRGFCLGIMVGSATPPPAASINDGNPIRVGQKAIPFTLSNFATTPTSVLCSYAADTMYITANNIVGNNTAVVVDLQDRIDGQPYPTIGSTLKFTITNGTNVDTETSTLALKQNEQSLIFGSVKDQLNTFLAYHFKADGFTVNGGEFTYLPFDNLKVKSDSSFTVSNSGTLKGWFRPISGLGAGNVYYYEFKIIGYKGAKPLSVNVLTSSNLIDSKAKTDGTAKSIVIRSDQFVTNIDSAFYTATGASTEWCSLFSGELDSKKINAVDVRFNAGQTPNAKLALSLPQKYTELWFELDLFVPSNFLRSGNSNNKFFRLWGDSYADINTLIGQKVGASMWGSDVNSGYAKLQCDVSSPIDGSTGSTGPRGTVDQTFIAVGDCGKWMHISIYAKAPTINGNSNVNNGDGIIRISKNGTVVSESLTVPNVGNSHLGYKNAYILGWPNSPYVNETHFYITNLAIRGKV